MSFFRKIGKGISSITKKAPSVVSSIFKKGGDISRGISTGLDKVGDVLGKVGSVVNNPMVQAGASSVFGPEAGLALGSLGKSISTAKQFAKKGSSISGSVGGISDDLSKGRLMAGIEKAKSLRDGVAGPTFM
jgi:hypothetical protein